MRRRKEDYSVTPMQVARDLYSLSAELGRLSNKAYKNGDRQLDFVYEAIGKIIYLSAVEIENIIEESFGE